MNNNIKNEIKEYQNQFDNSPAEQYVCNRGISKQTYQQFNLGYKKGVFSSDGDCLIIPISDTSYIEKILKDHPSIPKYKNINSGIFNYKVLHNTNTPIFVTEGVFDAFSIMEVGGVAVSINSTSMVDKFIEYIKSNKLTPQLIVAMDADRYGKDASRKLGENLLNMNIPYITLDHWNGCKDANDLLLKDRAALQKLITDYASRPITVKPKDDALLKKLESYRMDNNMENLLNCIEANADKYYISTGFPKLDKILEGGAVPGLYLLAAMTGLGKTTFFLQLMSAFAKQGYDCYFISLEMSKLELFGKIISRHSLEVLKGKDRQCAFSMRNIVDGSAATSEQPAVKQLFDDSIARFSIYADKIYIINGEDSFGIKDVKKIIENHIAVTGRTPILFLDYIQLLRPNEKLSDMQNISATITGLKRLVSQGVPVFAISSLNRGSYDAPIKLDGLKGNGELEYSSDVCIALDFAEMFRCIKNKTTFDFNAELDKPEREVVLTILKARNHSSGGKIKYMFYAKNNFFDEI